MLIPSKVASIDLCIQRNVSYQNHSVDFSDFIALRFCVSRCLSVLFMRVTVGPKTNKFPRLQKQTRPHYRINTQFKRFYVFVVIFISFIKSWFLKQNHFLGVSRFILGNARRAYGVCDNQLTLAFSRFSVSYLLDYLSVILIANPTSFNSTTIAEVIYGEPADVNFP